MTDIDYNIIISELNHRKVWVSRRISFRISSEEYIALLKGYHPHWDMRYGLIYDYQDDYFYSYRSGYVVGKYKVEKQRKGDYLFTEMYENPYKVDCMVIFECLSEACKQNNVSFDPESLQRYIYETQNMIKSD